MTQAEQSGGYRRRRSSLPVPYAAPKPYRQAESNAPGFAAILAGGALPGSNRASQRLMIYGHEML